MHRSITAVSRRRFLYGLFACAAGIPAARLRAGFDLAEPVAAAPAAVAAPLPPELSINSVELQTPHLALTFDDGPHGTLTPQLLDILAGRQARATFYLIGRNVESHPDIVARMHAEGHEVANHTWSHPTLSRLGQDRVASELERAHAAIQKACGFEPVSMRPPYGAVNNRIKQLARDRFAYTTVMWSVDPQDWRYRNANRVAEHLVQHAAAGAILLCHDIHATTVAAIPAVLDRLLGQGYRFATVSELMALGRAPAVEEVYESDSMCPADFDPGV